MNIAHRFLSSRPLLAALQLTTMTPIEPTIAINKRKAATSDAQSIPSSPKARPKRVRSTKTNPSSDPAQSAEYYFENGNTLCSKFIRWTLMISLGLRKVTPYKHVHETFVKRRWENRKLLDVYTKEFMDKPKAYYVNRC
jgi:hypothetical protein